VVSVLSIASAGIGTVIAAAVALRVHRSRRDHGGLPEWCLPAVFVAGALIAASWMLGGIRTVG
jgi:hypothetical protein